MPTAASEHGAAPDWVRELRERADRPPLRPRVALALGSAGCRIGSIEPALAQRLAQAGLPLAQAGEAWIVGGAAADAALAAIAEWLARQGLAGRWRNERLAVFDDRGRGVAAIERAAVRPLGIATQAVRLVGRDGAGNSWLQQRALDKDVDPGRWDTLVGGLVAHGESIAATLARETWEEAGLRIEALQGLAPLDVITVRRPLAEGWMVERMHVFEAVLPEGLEPHNQDGEVQRFERADEVRVVERLRAGDFTLEAALATLRAAGR